MPQPETSVLGTLLLDLYEAGVRAAQPEAAMSRVLAARQPSSAPQWIIAIGKAAAGQAASLVAWLDAHGRSPNGGIVVSTGVVEAASVGSLPCYTGEHPVPGAGSAAASNAIEALVASIPRGDTVHVALSGGGSSLVAAPLADVTAADMATTFALLLVSGLDIGSMNAVRKRITRWSAGRLAAALPQRPIHLWLISDVPGDNVADIGSGPCTGDPWRTADVLDVLARESLFDALPASVQAAVQRDTFKPRDAVFDFVYPELVASNRTALEAMRSEALARGYRARICEETLIGEAATAGRRLANELLTARGEVILWGGETTVRIAPGGAVGRGGRSQELALSAAIVLRGSEAVLLAAGTDGVDGNTPAAGAMVSGTTVDRIIASGHDPAHMLAAHDSYAAHETAGSLIERGPTGTNVMDVVVGINPVR